MAFLRRIFGGGAGAEKSASEQRREALVAERAALDKERANWESLPGDQRRAEILTSTFKVTKYRNVAKAFNAARSPVGGPIVVTMPTEPDEDGAADKIYDALSNVELNEALNEDIKRVQVNATTGAVGKGKVVYTQAERPVDLLASLLVRVTHIRDNERIAALDEEIEELERAQAEEAKAAAQNEKKRLEDEERTQKEEAARKAREEEEKKRKETEARVRALKEADDLRRTQEDAARRQREAEETRAQMAKAQQQQAAADDADASQEQHIRDLEEENERLLAENARMTAEIAEASSSLSSAKENLRSRTQQVNRAQATETKLNAELVAARTEAEKLRAELSAKISERDKAVQQLEARVRAQEEQIAQITGTKPEDERRREALERNNAELTQRAETLRREADELSARQDRERQTATVRIRDLESAAADAAAEKARLQSDLERASLRTRELDADLQRERAALAAGTTALGAKSRELDELKRTHEATEAELARTRVRTLQLEQQLELRRQQVDEAERARQAAQNALQGDQAEVAQLTEEIARLRREKRAAEEAALKARQEAEHVRAVEREVDVAIVQIDQGAAAARAAREAERLAARTRPKEHLVARTAYIQALRLPSNIKLAKKAHLIFAAVAGRDNVKAYVTDMGTLRTAGKDARAVAVYWDARPMPITFEVGENDKKTRRGQPPEIPIPAIGIALGLGTDNAIQHRFPQLDAAVIHGDLAALDEVGDDINEAVRGRLVLYFFPATEFSKTRRVRRLLFYRGPPLTEASIMPDVAGPADAPTADEEDEEGSDNKGEASDDDEFGRSW